MGQTVKIQIIRIGLANGSFKIFRILRLGRFDKIDLELKKTQKVISNLLILGQRKPLQKKVTDINRLVKNLIEITQQELTDRRIIVRPLLSTKLLPIPVDPEQLQIAL
ncbi:MAG: hypothetical protein ACE5I1_16235, partial [bacterium]